MITFTRSIISTCSKNYKPRCHRQSRQVHVLGDVQEVSRMCLEKCVSLGHEALPRGHMVPFSAACGQDCASSFCLQGWETVSSGWKAGRFGYCGSERQRQRVTTDHALFYSHIHSSVRWSSLRTDSRATEALPLGSLSSTLFTCYWDRKSVV